MLAAHKITGNKPAPSITAMVSQGQLMSLPTAGSSCAQDIFCPGPLVPRIDQGTDI